MKNLLLVTAIIIGLASCHSSDQQPGQLSDEQRRNALKDSANYTTIEWLDSTTREMGTAKEGTELEITYHFRNSGNHNLILSNVSAQCGCTTPNWPKKPIPPGEKDVIKAVFNSSNKVGPNHKEIYVLANTQPQSTTLAFNVQIDK